MRCYEPELPVADFNIDGAPAEGTGEKEGAHSFPRRKSYRKRKSRLGQEFLDLTFDSLRRFEEACARMTVRSVTRTTWPRAGVLGNCISLLGMMATVS